VGVNVPYLVNTGVGPAYMPAGSKAAGVHDLARASRDRRLDPANAEDIKLLRRAWKQLHGPGADVTPPTYTPEEERLSREALRRYGAKDLFGAPKPATPFAASAIGRVAKESQERDLDPDDKADRKLLRHAWDHLRSAQPEQLLRDHTPDELRRTRKALRDIDADTLFGSGGTAISGSPVGRLVSTARDRDLNPDNHADKVLLKDAWRQLNGGDTTRYAGDYTPEQAADARRILDQYDVRRRFEGSNPNPSAIYAGSAVTRLNSAYRARPLDPNETGDRELLKAAWRELYASDPKTFPTPYNTPGQIALAKRALEPYSQKDLFAGKTLQKGPPEARTFGGTDYTFAKGSVGRLAAVSEQRDLDVTNEEDRTLLRAAWEQLSRHDQGFDSRTPKDYSVDQRLAAERALRKYEAEKFIGKAPTAGAPAATAGCRPAAPSYYDRMGLKHTHVISPAEEDLLWAGCPVCGGRGKKGSAGEVGEGSVPNPKSGRAKDLKYFW
jgi:hypothetical protein